MDANIFQTITRRSQIQEEVIRILNEQNLIIGSLFIGDGTPLSGFRTTKKIEGREWQIMVRIERGHIKICAVKFSPNEVVLSPRIMVADLSHAKYFQNENDEEFLREVVKDYDELMKEVMPGFIVQ